MWHQIHNKIYKNQGFSRFVKKKRMTTKSFAEQILFLIKNEELYNNLEEKHMGHRSLKKMH